MNKTIKTSKMIEAVYRLNAIPPSSTGLSSRSPTTAPSGRVRMNAIQNKTVRETLVKK